MNDILHILINDEIVEEGPLQTVYSFFEMCNQPFIQIKDAASQLKLLVDILPADQKIAIWVHPNAHYQGGDGNVPTPGEKAMAKLHSQKIDFNLVSRIPDDIRPKLLESHGKPAIQLAELYLEIDKVQPITVGSIRGEGSALFATTSASKVPERKIAAAIIAALYESEFENLDQFFESPEAVDGFDTLKYAKLKNSDKWVLIDFQPKMGMVDATSLTTRIIDRFSPRHFIMVGVCGGRESKGVKLRDIVIPDTIMDYQTGKLDKGEFKPYLNSCTIHNAKAISVSAEIKTKMLALTAGDLRKKCAEMKFHSKTMVCGSQVVKTAKILDDLAKRDEEIVALEMESYGVARAAELLRKRDTDVLVIKSVMDYTDGNKDDSAKEDSAYLSACFAYFLVKDHL